ncbi:MAG: GHKL domain-containing protein [Bacillota bacterium]|jgi:sensor histidine kinase YesM
MKQIVGILLGDTEHFSFEHRIFNFALLLGIFMTFFGALLDLFSLHGGWLWFAFGTGWLFLYYLSRVKRYFETTAIVSCVMFVLIFFPYSWFCSYGIYGVFPYYAVVAVAVISIILTGWPRFILIFSLIAVVLLVIGLDYYYPDLIVKYDRILDVPALAVHLAVALAVMAVLIIGFSNIYLDEKARSEEYAKAVEAYYQQQLYYMENLEQLIYRLKAERHDFNHHLGVIYGLLEDREIEDARNYTQKLVNTAAEFQNMANIPYAIVRAMLNYKLSAVKENQIRLQLKINLPGGLPLNEFDVTIILGNLLDNAMEACAKIAAKDRYIDLSIRYKPNYLIIRIENPLGAGPVLQEGNNRTTKQDNQNHGFGLNNIEYLVNKNHGFFKIGRENGIFAASIALLLD